MTSPRAVGATARRAADAATRVARAEARRVTAPRRVLPDFLVLGAQKAGTTSMIRFLRSHPNVHPHEPGEIQFFSFEWPRGERWYRSHFPLAATQERTRRRTGRAPLVGEKSPLYLFHPAAPARVAATLPHARLVAVLREPAARAVSHWNMNRRRGWEPLDLPDALDAEPARIGPELDLIAAGVDEPAFGLSARYSYLARGRYAEQLDRWTAHVDRDRLLVLRAEDLFAHPEPTYRRLLDHLGLPPHTAPFPRANEARARDDVPDAVLARIRAELADDLARLATGWGVSWP